MGKETGISWTGATWNPHQGCIKISPGCKNCYMYTMFERFGKSGRNIHRSADATFYAPLKWKEPGMVFTCSLSDFFIEEADAWRDEEWDVIRRTPHLTYQILTKRPERIAAHLPSDWGEGYPNVWLGVSAENQEYADERIPKLLSVPAAIYFVSYEPALGPVSLKWAWVSKGKPLGGGPMVNLLEPWAEPTPMPGLDWIICGGESGPNRREFKQEWAEHIMQQCEAAGIAFFMKQMSAITPTKAKELIPIHLNVQQFPAEK